MATGADTYKHRDGKAVQKVLTSSVTKDDVVYVDGWLGIAQSDGDSDDLVAIDISMQEFFFTVPSGLTVISGATVWVDVTDLTGHRPDDSAYATSAGSNRQRLFRATAAKDVNHNVPGILLGGLGLA